MLVKEKILELAKQNNGFLTTSMLSGEGISRGHLGYLVEQGKLEQYARGVYVLPSVIEDEFLNLQVKYKQGIFCCETALFLMDLTDRTPWQYKMIFPQGYNLTNAKREGLVCYQQKISWQQLGVVRLKSPSGNFVNAYGAEKTLCDILRPHMHCDIQVITEAYKRYGQWHEKNIPQLSTYAKLFHVEAKVRSYLEVLL